MKNTLVVAALGFIIIAVGTYVLLSNNTQPLEVKTLPTAPVSPEETLPTTAPPLKETRPTTDTRTSTDPTQTPGEYTEYSRTLLEQKLAEGKKVVLFFYAAWCPTCRSAHNNIQETTHEIPTDVVILRTDYDQEKVLKNKYGVSYQHTFVQVAEDGSVVTKFHGGRDVSAIVTNLQ